MDAAIIANWLVEEMDYTDVKQLRSMEGKLYFSAKDEDEEDIQLEFETEDDRVVISYRKPGGTWYILDILYPDGSEQRNVYSID
jgi:hypothetical protein